MRQNAQKIQSNGTAVTATTPVTSANASPVSTRSTTTKPVEDGLVPIQDAVDGSTLSGSSMPLSEGNANLMRTSLVAHQRSQSLSGLQVICILIFRIHTNIVSVTISTEACSN